MLFAQFVLLESWSLCVVNKTTEAWRTPPRFSGLVYSADHRGLTCVMNNSRCGHGAVNIVYRAFTVVADVL